VTRVLSGVVLLLAVASAAWWGPPLLLLAIAVGVALLATFEYASIAGHLRAPIDRGAAAVAAVAVCTAVAWPGLGAAEPVVMASVLAMAILAVGRGQTSADSLARVAASVFGPLYIGLPLGALVAVHWMYGREAALLLILVVIVSDTAQYYAAVSWGAGRSRPPSVRRRRWKGPWADCSSALSRWPSWVTGGGRRPPSRCVRCWAPRWSCSASPATCSSRC
jgi:CDP-diglyceride synthetase